MFCNFMTMVEHGWTSVLKKQMIELELTLSKLTDFIMHAIESLRLPPHTLLTLWVK